MKLTMKSTLICATLVILFTTCIGYADLTDGLVAHYTFDGDTQDSSGNSNHGIEYGGVSYVDGVIGKAAKFDGLDDYVEIGYSDTMDVWPDFTISAWISQHSWKPQSGAVITRGFGGGSTHEDTMTIFSLIDNPDGEGFGLQFYYEHRNKTNQDLDLDTNGTSISFKLLLANVLWRWDAVRSDRPVSWGVS